MSNKKGRPAWWELVIKAANDLNQNGQIITNKAVTAWIKFRYPDYNKLNTNPDLYRLSVNVLCRCCYAGNQKARRTDSGNRNDYLFKLGPRTNVTYELYQPAVHGTWEIDCNSQGTFYIRQISIPDEKDEARQRQVEFERAVDIASDLTTKERQQRLITTTDKYPKTEYVTTKVFIRNPNVVAEVLDRAQGKCEECKKDAPFIRAKDETPYLEVHHVIPLSDGGQDTIENAIAVCPNCHRRAHFG